MRAPEPRPSPPSPLQHVGRTYGRDLEMSREGTAPGSWVSIRWMIARRTVIVPAFLLACGISEDKFANDDTSTTSSTSAGSSSGPTTSSTSTGPTTSSTSTGPATDSASGPTTGSGSDCGGTQCGSDDFCDYLLDSCAETTESTASCSMKPPADNCGALGGDAPVCGCDGQVYDNILCAQAAGVDLSLAGGCTPPADTFECGATFCDPTMSFCSLREAPIAVCEVLPSACTADGATPTCDCLPVKCAPGQTEVSCDDTDGKITVVCEPA